MIKGYKVFNPDWTCRGFQYAVGETYQHNGPIGMREAGFHFCQKASDCFNYCDFNPANKVAEVEAIGLTETNNDKSVTDRIRIVREVPWQELLTIVNTGSKCTGIGNTGDYNTGNYNTGNYNTGNYNTGNWNVGSWNVGNYNTRYYNTGDCNTGSYNTGDCNTGDYNTGYCNNGSWNTGDYNTGSWNTGDYNTGFFNTDEPFAMAFNKPTTLRISEFKTIKGVQILSYNYKNNCWIYSENMDDAEKAAHPEHETTGGYLKSVPFKDACKMMWDRLSEDEKAEVKKIPNFDAAIFEEITGIKV